MHGFPRTTPQASRLSASAMGAAAAMALFLSAAPSAKAQPVDISGMVRDESSGQPLPGFVVRLQARGLADTTDEGGRFHLRNAPGRGERSPLQRLVYSHRHGFALRLSQDEDVAAEILNGAGRTLVYGQYSVKAGDWSLKPVNLEAGLYTVKLWTGSRLRALRLEIRPADGGRGRPGLLLVALTPEQSAEALAPPPGVIVDSLRLEKPGYLSQRVPVRSWSQDGITVSIRREAGEGPGGRPAQ